MTQRPNAPRHKTLRGVAAVELALTMVPLLILTFGVTEYGRAIFTYNAHRQGRPRCRALPDSPAAGRGRPDRRGTEPGGVRQCRMARALRWRPAWRPRW